MSEIEQCDPWLRIKTANKRTTDDSINEIHCKGL